MCRCVVNIHSVAYKKMGWREREREEMERRMEGRRWGRRNERQGIGRGGRAKENQGEIRDVGDERRGIEKGSGEQTRRRQRRGN